MSHPTRRLLSDVPENVDSRSLRPVTLFDRFKQLGFPLRYNLAPGAPDSTALRHTAEIMRAATAKRLTQEISADASLLQYGAEAGDPRYLFALQKFLQTEYGDAVDVDDLVCTSGASAGLFYLLNCLFPNRCPVFVERNTYMIAVSVLKYLQFPIESIPDGVNGHVDLDALERRLETYGDLADQKQDRPYTGVLYLVPTFHNPTGRTMSPAACERVVHLARRYNLLVLCDDVYNLLYYDENMTKPPKRLFAYDRKTDADYVGHVVSNGSFSKYLAPGLRLGWLEIPDSIRKKHWLQSPVLDSGGSLNMFTSGLVAVALEDGAVSKWVQQLRDEYRSRLQAVADVFRERLPKGCKADIPDGGYFVWLKLPECLTAKTLIDECVTKHKLMLMAGSRFNTDDSAAGRQAAERTVRLAISNCDATETRDAMQLLCDTILKLVN